MSAVLRLLPIGRPPCGVDEASAAIRIGRVPRLAAISGTFK